MLIFVYNSILLSLTSLFIIQEERSFTDALKASWAASKGNVLNILIASLLVGIVIAIASWIASVPTVVYSVISALVLAVDGQSAVSSMTLISSPGYLLSMIPTVLVSAFASIASIFAEVAILAELTQKTKSRK
jgi:membrane-anchored glycerophosphoryl diester phosphodiesterase (GDPDase)